MRRSCHYLTLLICCVFVGRTLSSSNGKSDKSQALNPRKCLVWGPGLDPEVVLPARYFFIQLVDFDGQNFTDSVGEKEISVDIVRAKTGERARIWTQVLDRHDGSYIVRYKLYNSLEDLKISVYYNSQHLAHSPYKLRGPVYSEDCYCPEPDRTKWMKAMKCPKSYEQIKRDLAIFSKIDMKAVEKEAVARYNRRGSHSLCHYSIIDNKIYRKTHGQHVGFKIFMDNILLSLARKVKLPDMEFIVNLGDWPLVTKKRADTPIPIFSWCGSDDSNDIIMPTYDITEATLETMGRVMLDMLSVQANTGPKWENKTAQGFFRGRDSRQERLDLVKLSRKHPDVLDAKLTNMFFFKHNKEEVGELVKHISFFDFFKYKYQISLDGTVAAYRLPYLLAGDAVVLKQDSPYYEFFYKNLIPYEHYIPIKRDISDVLEKIQWAKDNDEEAQQIAKNAQKYVRDHLLADEIFCYHMVLFEEYSKLLVSKPHIYKEMERVDQPTSSNPCHCRHPDSNDVRRDEL